MTEHISFSINYPAMPFHHLISAVSLASDSSLTRQSGQSPSSNVLIEGKAILWQLLAASGIPPHEAVLFDDAIECSFIELVDQYPVQVDWEVLHLQSLAGCCEIYLAEMFICKQNIYEAGGAIPPFIEFSGEELAEFLPERIFVPFVDDIAKLFILSLTASYVLTVSLMNINLLVSPMAKKPRLFSDLFESFQMLASRRFNNFISQQSIVNGTPEMRCRINLSDYWSDWQKAARLARFDFDFLRTLKDARIVRFYELTKLKRASIPAPNINVIDDASRYSLSIDLEIEYEQFAALMPLPRLKGEREIKKQINELVKPLRAAGYVKTFAIESDERSGSARRARLVFRFNDD